MKNGLAWVLLLVGVAALILLGHLAANVYPGAAQKNAMLRAAIERDLDALGHDWAVVDLDAGQVVLTGLAPSAAAKAGAEDVVACALTGKSGWAMNSAVTLGAAAAAPAVAAPAAPAVTLPDWGAQITGPGAVRLFGLVPTDGIRLNLLEAARGAFPNGVVDQMSVGEIAGPEGLWERITAGFGQFGRFVTGLWSFDAADGFRLEGEGPDSAISFLQQDMAGFAGVPVSLDVTPVEVAVAELGDLNLTPDATADVCGEAFSRVMAENAVTFEYDSAVIDRISGEVLDKVMGVARNCKAYALSVEGHTDADGSAVYNEGLSQRRADAVVAYLVARGFPEGQISGVGFGESRPIADNSTDAGKARNRRIEFVVSAQE